MKRGLKKLLALLALTGILVLAGCSSRIYLENEADYQTRSDQYVLMLVNSDTADLEAELENLEALYEDFEQQVELYPFIGGDTVRRSEPMPGGLQPSVNRILPYASPEYAEIGQDAAWELSLCCLENARDILLALETEYRALYARSLTLGRLSEAVILPLCPDKGGCMTYDINRAASTYLEGDIELLKRMKSIH